MSRISPSSIESCLSELLQEEQCLVTQAALPLKASSGLIDVAYIARGKAHDRDMSRVKCFP